jgi:pimeloyl-ACP methyl ester carboxylesterase
LVGSIPVTVFRPADGAAAPVVVIAHGFAGSQQLMLPFATTLARNGYIAVTFDFPGHGRNAEPLAGGLVDPDASGNALLAALDRVAAFARPLGDGRIAVLGHSMASEIVVRYAQAHPETAATVAVSLFAPAVTASSPRNLLVIDGALEVPMLIADATRVVGTASAGAVKPGTTYGDFGDGTARRLVLARDVEHIGVLYSADAMAETLDWLNQAFDRHETGYLDRRGKWLGLLFLGLVALAWPLASLLPVIARRPVGAGARWGRLLLVTLVSAVATPLLLWKLPTDFLPLLLGDYLVVHFAVFGLLTAIGMGVTGGRRSFEGSDAGISPGMVVLAAAAVALYAIGAIDVALDRFVTSSMPIPSRLPLIAAMLIGTLPYFLVDEWLVRGAMVRPGAYAATKLGFLLSLMLAVALNPERLFFLVIIIPVMLIFFTVFGLFSAWAYRRTGHPFVGGLANAIAFAWAIAVTFPVVAR